MTTVEAFFTFVLTKGRKSRPDGSEPDHEELAAIWKEWVVKEPKVARVICAARDMGEFIARVHGSVKAALWEEHLRFGNSARITSAMYSHNNTFNLLQGSRKGTTGHAPDGKSQLLQFERVVRMVDGGSRPSVPQQRALADRCIAWAAYAADFKEACADKACGVVKRLQAPKSQRNQLRHR